MSAIKPGTFRKFQNQAFFAVLATTALSCLLMSSCGGGGGTSTPPPTSNPIPSITSLSPSSATAGTAAQTLTINGTSFMSSSTVTYNSVAHTAAYVSSTQLTIQLSASDQATAGSFAVVVTNPSPGGGPSNSVNFTVKLSVQISPTSTSVQVFHTAQFTATVVGASNTAVTWSVNGTTGGTLAAGEISSSGLYNAPNVVPSPSTVTVSATSQADSTQKASATVTITGDTTPPSVVSTSPPSGASGVSQTAAISAQFSEGLDPATVNSKNIVLSNGAKVLPARATYDPTSNTVNLIPQGILEAATTYTTSIGGAVSDLAENQLGTAYVWSFTTQAAAGVNTSISVPAGLDPTTLKVLSFGGQEVAPDSQGNASAGLRPYGTTLVAAMMPGQALGFLALTIGGMPGQAPTPSVSARRDHFGLHPTVHTTRWQITASPMAASQPATVTVDFQTTAESLLFLTPPLMNASPAKAQVIMAAIAADPNTGVLAQALAAAWNEAQPLGDSAVQTAMQNAVVSVLTTLTGGPNAQAPAQATTAQTRARFQHGMPVHSQVSSQPSEPPQISTTPNCGSGSTTTSGSLPCLDLDYISLQGSISPDSSGNYVVTVNNCTNSSLLGCAVGWLAQVAPIANVPSGGVGWITPGQGSNGPDSPVDPPGDPLMPTSCTPPADVSGCTSVFWVPASSNFQYVDISNDIATGAEDLINFATGQTADQVGFGIPASTQQSYIARFYSGGFADSAELSNVYAGSYTGGLPLWSSALTMNALTDVETALSGAGVLPDGMLSCMTQQVVSTQLIGQVSQLQQELSSSNVDVGSLLLSAVTQIGGDFVGAAEQCALDEASESLLDFLVDIARQAAEWVSVIPDILSAASAAGQVTQQIVEMHSYATPVETALASVGNPAPQVASIQLTCPDSNMLVGQQQTCSAAAFDAQNNSIPASQVSLQWVVSGLPGVANLTNADSTASQEQVTAMSAGQVSLIVTAPRSQGGPLVQASCTLDISPAALASLTLIPTSTAGAVGTTWFLMAQGADSLGNPVPVSSVTWTTSDTSVASVAGVSGAPSEGEVQAVGSGNATITASAGGLTAKASVSVGGVGGAGTVVLVTPALAVVPAATTQLFTATVTGVSNNNVNWAVNGISGGNSTVGTITTTGTTGLYTAPATVPSPATVTVTATSQAAPAFSGSAFVTVGPYLVHAATSFSSTVDGAAPTAPLIQALDGYFYGTSQRGGANGGGTVFRVDSMGNITPLASFSGSDGANPVDALVQATDGYFYGTTQWGGANNEGAIFKVDSQGNLTNFYSFTGGDDGAEPLAGLIQANDGSLYGAAWYGGAYNEGTVFKIDLSGNFSTLYSFSGGSDGSAPWGGLIQASDGYLYGTTSGGGGYSYGTIFKMDLNGTLNTLYSFTGGSDGATPSEALLQASNGLFYGTALYGGDTSCTVSNTEGCGTVFQVDSQGGFNTMHQFSGEADGGVPFSALVQAPDGDFYGTTVAGGDPSCAVYASGEDYTTYIGCGTVFKMDSLGDVSPLYSFTGTPSDGSNPMASLLVGSDGYFYGTTRWGGSDPTCTYTNAGGCGTIFKVTGPEGTLSLREVAKVRRSAKPPLNPKPLTRHARSWSKTRPSNAPQRAPSSRGLTQPSIAK